MTSYFEGAGGSSLESAILLPILFVPSAVVVIDSHSCLAARSQALKANRICSVEYSSIPGSFVEEEGLVESNVAVLSFDVERLCCDMSDALELIFLRFLQKHSEGT